MPDSTQICPRCGRAEPAHADFCYCGFIFAKEGQRGTTPPMPAVSLTTPVARWDGRNLAWQCGQASLAAPFVSLVLSCLTRAPAQEGGITATILIIVVWGLPLFGFFGAVVALVGVGKYGRKGLLWQGLLGLLINSGLIALILKTLAHK